MLQLPIPQDNKNPTLRDCLDLYTESELLKDDNMYYNEKTQQKEEARKDIKFWSLPDVLILTLKRFSNNMKKICFPARAFLSQLSLHKSDGLTTRP